MPCAGCARRKAKLKGMLNKLIGKTPPEPEPGLRLSISCPCGLQRMIPEGTKVGSEFTLVPCPRCGQAYHAKLLGSYVEKLDG